MNQTWPRKTLSLNFRNRNNVKIYDLEDDFKVEKEIEKVSVTATDETNKLGNIAHEDIQNGELGYEQNNTLDTQNQQQDQNLEEFLPNKKLFKKTLSRIVFVQLIDSILASDDLKNEISTANLLDKFHDLMDFITDNNNYECSFLRDKQLSNNFIYDLFLIFNQNYLQIEQSVKESCKNHWEIYISEAMHSSIIYGAITEFLYMEEKKSEKDHKKIILNEYLLVSECFLNESEMKFVNGILNTIFYKSVENTEEIVENIEEIENQDQIIENIIDQTDEENIDQIDEKSEQSEEKCD